MQFFYSRSLLVLLLFIAACAPALRERPSSTPSNDQKSGRPRPDRPDEALLWRMKSFADENGLIDSSGMLRAKAHVDAMRAAAPLDAGITPTTWTSLGPGNYGGRIRSFLIDPTDPARMFVGSVSGGIWTTSNSGQTWTPVNDFLANLAVASLVMSADGATLYAGTGEGFFNNHNARGAGIFKSADRGATWTQLASTATSDFYYVNRLALSADGNTLIAATTTGIFRSTNAGTSFTRATLVGGAAISVGENGLTDIDFHPTDSTRAIASGYHGQAYFSTNGGATWTAATNLPTDANPIRNRVELTYAKANPQVVVASVDINRGALYVSSNGGESYTVRYSGSDDTNDPLGNQGWYDNIVWVKPTDASASFIVWGGVDLFRSTDGGVTFSRISTYLDGFSAHADHHVIVEHPQFNDTSNRVVYFGTDGGPYRAADINTVGTPCEFRFGGCANGWSHLNSSLAITQFYGAGGHAATGRIVGGTQDNYSIHYDPARANAVNAWGFLAGGDGGFSAHDPSDPLISYGEYINAQVHRNTTGGHNGSFFITCYNADTQQALHPNALTDAGGPDAEFIAPLILDPNNADRLLVGTVRLWRTNDAKTSVGSGGECTTGPAWQVIKPALSGARDYITAIAVTRGNSDVIYVGHGTGRVYRSANGTAANPTWAVIDDNGSTNPLPNRRVTRITIDPSDPSGNTVYATLGGFAGDNVYKSINGGATWTDMTGPNSTTGLPDVPVRDLEVHPSNAQWLYAATEIGIFASENGGTSWHVPGDGPANVPVDELFFLGTRLIAVTHGRGLFAANTVANASPTVSAIDQQRIAVNSSKQVSFTIGDAETDASQLSLFASAVQGSAVTFSGSGANRIATITPERGSLLPDTISLYVGDGTNVTTRSFAVTVYSPQPPTISSIASRTGTRGVPLTVTFTVADPDSPLDSLTLTAESNNPDVVALSSISFGGSGANRSLTLTPGGFGQANVNIILRDPDGISVTTNFNVTVPQAIPQPPTISSIAAQTATPGVPLTVTFTVGDPDSPLDSLTLTANSTNPNVVAPASITFGGSGATRTATLTASGGGTTSVTVTVRDPQALSAATSFGVTVSQVPGVPTMLPAAVNGNTVTLAWTAPTSGPPATGYVLTASLSAGGPPIATVPLNSTVTSLTVTAPNGLFFITVRAVNAVGTGGPSNEISFVVGPPPPPGAPRNLAASVAGSTFTITWDAPATIAVAPVATYIVEAGSAPSLTDLASFPVGTARAFTTPPVPNGRYFMRVRAQNASGISSSSNEVAVTVGPPPAGPPVGLTGSATNRVVMLTWSAPTSGVVTGYQLQAGSAPGLSDLARVGLPIGQTTFQAPGVPPGTYYLRIASIDAYGPGAVSNEIVLIVQ